MDHIENGKKWARKVLERIESEEKEFAGDGEHISVPEKGILVCEGDSWFDYRPLGNRDILKWLINSNFLE